MDYKLKVAQDKIIKNGHDQGEEQIKKNDSKSLRRFLEEDGKFKGFSESMVLLLKDRGNKMKLKRLAYKMVKLYKLSSDC